MSDTHSMPEYAQKLLQVWDRMKTGQAGFYELTDIVEEAISKEKQDLLEDLKANLPEADKAEAIKHRPDDSVGFMLGWNAYEDKLREKLAEMKGENR